jgi:hypothetical protein
MESVSGTHPPQVSNGLGNHLVLRLGDATEAGSQVSEHIQEGWTERGQDGNHMVAR